MTNFVNKCTTTVKIIIMNDVDIMSISSSDSYPTLARKRQQNFLKEIPLSKMLHSCITIREQYKYLEDEARANVNF